MHLEEKLNDDLWDIKDWKCSEFPDKEFSKFKLSAGAFYNDGKADKGLQTTQVSMVSVETSNYSQLKAKIL